MRSAGAPPSGPHPTNRHLVSCRLIACRSLHDTEVPAAGSSQRREPMSTVRPVTIRDVARQAGVSLSTVSQVLNGRPGYASATTRDRVLEVARELGYRPNALARGLVTSRTGTLGVVITDITRTFFTQVVGSVEQSADHILQVTRMGVPLVVINRALRTPGLHQIAWDDVEIGQRATEHLIGLGHRRIAHVSGSIHPPVRRSAADRLSGYQAALTAAGIPVEPALIVEGRYEYQPAFAACGRLFDRPNPPTAVFAASDSMAVAIVNALHRRGMRVPDG